METMSAMNSAQVEVMNMMSFVNTKSSWQRMKEAIADLSIPIEVLHSGDLEYCD